MTRRRKRQLIIISLILIVGIGVMAYFRKEKETIKYENTGSLTMEEKLEDFEYLYSFIADNYPFLKVNERVNGIDWLGEKENFKKAIENTTDDYMFTEEVDKIITKLNNWHTHILGGASFIDFYSLYSNPEYEDMFKPWFDVLNDEKTFKWYKFDEKQLEGLQQQQSYAPDAAYCKTDIIIPNEVAYLKIKQMNFERAEKDGDIIRDFLQEIKDYNKLIIDIRGNGDGSDHYWMKNLVEPLINQEISVDNYVFVRGDYGKSFYEYKKLVFSPTSELDKEILDGFPEEIKTDFSYYYTLNRTIKPVNSVGFNGKIYLIVDEKVYSSSESFAAFCKDSEFATLVGSTTGGDGIGFDPLFFSLPNSGMVIRFSGELALNGDGTINEEVHTVPDIEIDPTVGTTYERDKAIQYIINN